MIRTVKELYNYREMISSLIKRDLRGISTWILMDFFNPAFSACYL